MPQTDSVTRRYTPPTCTLQIVDRNSSLSRWAGRRATSSLQFDLRFDDPRLLEEKQISIQGDRYQLEALHQAVTNYVQELLNSSPDQFNTLLQGETSPTSDVAVSSTSPTPDTEIPQNLESETSYELNRDSPETAATPTEAIFLQPGRRLTHNLFLGSLATEATGSVIQLGLLQLFDLVTALDEYATDVVLLPGINRSTRSTATPSGVWAGIAAVLVLSVGITAVVLPLLNRSNNQQQLADRSAVPDSSSIQQPSPQPSPTSATPPQSSLGTLPPLPPADPNNPIPSSSPNAELPGTNAPGTLPNVPNPQTTIPSPGTSQANLPQIGTSPLPTLKTPSSVLVNPVPRQDGAYSSKQGDTSASSSTRSPNFSLGKVPDTVPNSLPQLSSPNISTSTSERNNSTASSAKTRGDTSSSTADSSATSTTEQRLRAAIGRQSSGNQNASGQNTPSESKTTKVATASAAPQVTEAREFFQKHWQPPAGLKQTLEYSVVLDVDGTIQRIEPLGQASRTYVDRSGLPLIGERFVSPNRSGQTPRIRVVLSPDGSVQTFQETE